MTIIQVISSREYLVLYFFLAGVLFFSTAALGYSAEAIYYKTKGGDIWYPVILPYSILLTRGVAYLAVCLLAGYLLRNIVMSRSLTIGSKNGCAYLFHFTFPFSIVPVISWLKAAQVHTTAEENAQFYLTRERSSLNNFFIRIGCAATLISGIHSMTAADKLGSGVATGIAVLSFLTALMYPMLKRVKSAVYWMVGFNLCSLACKVMLDREMNGLLAYYFVSVYISMYVMMEMFHPVLKDVALVEAEEQEAAMA
ncbi:hypothetical protein [Chitinophaga rhizophila]|uniref:Uncharacterized protein n=1 Tax=Chitinophaga rhizophila TaxID=2866212 RepID=A0ABS7GBF3_9BACT|nr:hypothetical protein [Chitinophaga rhizophila]MBW8684149.1 hypothetical protein [Chitinophaga rhizophila]